MGDAGSGSGNVGDLRYCIGSIDASQATATSYYISFGTTGTIYLSNGQLPALAGKAFNIDGTGITMDAGDSSGIFCINSDATAEIDDITLTNAANAPAVVNNGTLTMVGGTTSDCLAGADENNGTEELDNRDYFGMRGVNGGALEVTLNATETLNGDTFVSNSAIRGGAIWNDGSTTITNCSLGWNTATAGGAIANSQRLTATAGGAIANSQRLTVTDTSIYANSASDLGGGIYNYTRTANLTIRGSSDVFFNSANEGGGIYNTSPPGGRARIRIDGATIDYNTATDCGGGIYNDGRAVLFGAVIDNNWTANGQGGGIYASANATTTIIGTSFDANASGAANGGNAIYQVANGNLYLFFDSFGDNQDIKT